MYKTFSITNLIDSDPRYSKLKLKLESSKNSDDRDVYIKELLHSLPLTLYPSYETFLQRQAVPISSRPENGIVFRSSLSTDELVTCVDDTLLTFYDHFMFVLRNFPEKDCLGYRPYNKLTNNWENYYKFDTYSQIFERCQDFGSGIISLISGSSRDKKSFIVSILSQNNPEWVISDISCQIYSLTTTALYETLDPETLQYILNLTESPVLIFTMNNLAKIINSIPFLKHLKILICMDDLSKDEISIINNSILHSKKLALYSFKQVEQIGQLVKFEPIPPKPESIYTICFTSGTTGLPKGVELTQQNITAGLAFAFSAFDLEDFDKNQLYDMCFLPLTHIFQRMITMYGLSIGLGIGFLHKPDPTVLIEDLKILKPNVLAVVPRILSKIESQIKLSIASSTMKQISLKLMKPIISQKIRDSLGFTNIAYLVTGSAPISKSTLIFLREILDIGVRQGYGMTETFAGICLSQTDEPKKSIGSSGAIGITSELKLKDVADMNYFTKDLKGEILLRGPQIFAKYYKNEKDTNASIDQDGWFSTGDVGFVDENGRLHIIDRVKNFFKLSQGEYIAPEKIENSYLSSCPFINQIFIYGNSFESYLIGILSIDPEIVKSLLVGKKLISPKATIEELIDLLNNDKFLKRQLLSLINKTLEGKNLLSFEKIHNFYVGVDLLKVEDNIITPTLKIKRHQATQFFKNELDILYQEGSLVREEKL
ncbi:hypothetical protein KAFR_0G02780 [Kazachstania africana CBS 2517]|uniref:AMP-dependent synthetase/ligase domain-containing protein n=1 Tax=Kazachstania africana (strain ATCC 22294 / BCRC 22015 / CBS 2517 / CECT 1963 / NBRC 1671 / NRRL Y-8276) TaxID=1071382 RepID=H2AY59_KAZAF|nr:hypothetical protein KAFR_0G02780 [Kazachstania africana CBS 2517]CCF59309.1 hypothetical protein KAFR_0G02780 [Kazachstania africana CBS 2517]